MASSHAHAQHGVYHRTNDPTNTDMNHTRRSILRKATALSALAIGASGMASAADCSGAPSWDEVTLYSTGDQVQHPDTDGVDALWEAALDSRNAEPSRSSAYWDYVGDCDGGGGGNESPVASFTTDVSTPDPGQDVTFDASGSSDPDGSISSYDWDFGDGTSASGQTATHSYGSAGDYTVTLTVTDDAGATGTDTTTVSVSDGGTSNQAPDASFTVSPSSPDPGESASFDAADSSDSDGTIESYSWDFGDGNSASGQTASHSYGSSGDYTVTLTVTDDDGATDSNSTTVSVESSSGGGGNRADCGGVAAYDPNATYTGGDQVVHDDALWTAEWWTQGTEPAESENVWTLEGNCNQGPTAAFSTDPASPQPGDAVTFDGGDSSDPDGSIASYSWTIDGSSASGQTTTRTFDEERFVTVELTVTDDSGVSATTTEAVAIGDPNRLPTASFVTDEAFPQPGEAIEFDASESGDADGTVASHDWDFGDGTTASGEVVTHTYSAEGEYEVQLTVTDDEGGTDTTSTTLNVSESFTGQQRVVAYYRQWAQYDRNYVPADVPYDKVTHVQYAFARPEQDGSVNLVGDSHGQQAFWGEEDWQGVDGGTFAEHAEQHPDTNFVLSIGGWGDSEYFSDAALTEENRQRFAQDCVTWIERGNLDGIDIDWEFPGGGGCTEDSEGPACGGVANNVRAGDQERFTLLCQAVRDALDEAAANDPDRHEPYELTAAVSASPEVVEGQADGMNGLEHGQLSEILDFVNVMTFDYRGIWSDYTGHHAPLAANPNDPSENAAEWNAQYALEYWEDAGWEPEQLNMAVPFYGRSWTDVQQPDGAGNGQDDGLFQPYLGEGADASGDGSYPGPGGQGTSLSGVWEAFDLLGSGRGSSNTLNLDGAGWETHFDEDASCSWSFNVDDRLMITHPTEQSIQAKMTWLDGSPYGGTMLWAIGGDTKDETLITTLWNALNG